MECKGEGILVYSSHDSSEKKSNKILRTTSVVWTNEYRCTHDEVSSFSLDDKYRNTVNLTIRREND
jgi:hypothetical protein